MESTRDEKLRAIWKQARIPVIYRSGKKEDLMVKLPYRPDNRQWLRGLGPGWPPIWDSQYKSWRLPRSRFDELVGAILEEFEQAYVVQPYREKEICAPACWNATGFLCACSCLGANHGRGQADGWFAIAETLAVRWGERQYGCRLLKRKW